MSKAKSQPKKYKRDIIEVHVDSCAMMGTSSIEAVLALGDLYDKVRDEAIKRREAEGDARGYKRLVYVETEQGLREKTERTNRKMWERLGSPNKNYNNFLRLCGERAEIHQTQFCRAFEDEFFKKIYPKMVDPVLKIMDDMHHEVQQKAYEIIEKNDPETLTKLNIGKPADIALEFSDKETEKNGKKWIRSEVAGPKFVKQKNQKIDDAVKLAVQSVFEKKWQPLIREKSERNGGLFSRENAKLGSFKEMLRQHQQLGAIAAQLAYELEPEHMKEAGYEKSPLTLLGDDQFDPQVIKQQAHQFPVFSLLQPPLSNLPKESRNDITMQALKLSGFWPWARKSHMEKKHVQCLEDIQYNCADYAILDYFMSELPKKADADRRALVVVTHDAPLIQQFAEFSTGFKYDRKQESVRDEYGRKTKGKKDTVEPLTLRHYECKRPQGSIVHFQGREPDKLPPHAALTGLEFVEFVEHELDEVRKQVTAQYGSDHDAPPTIRGAIDGVVAALRGLRVEVAKDEMKVVKDKIKPRNILTERMLFDRIETANHRAIPRTDIGGGVMEIGRGGGR